MKKDLELKTARLVLKPLGVKYLDTTDEYSRDLENTKYMMFLPNETKEETEKFLLGCDKMWEDENCPVYECAVLLDGKHIGAVSLDIEDGVAEFGWILNRKYWGKGYTFEAAIALRDFAVEKLGIRNFIAHCDAENRASYRVMEKLGMVCSDKTGGRRNKTTAEGEEREELTYKLDIDVQ